MAESRGGVSIKGRNVFDIDLLVISSRVVLTCDIFQVTQRINHFDNALGSWTIANEESDFDAVSLNVLFLNHYL